MTTIATATPPKLPFWRTVASCYMTVGQNFGQLVRISWLWLLIMLPVYAAVYWLIWQGDTGSQQAGAGSSAAVAVSLLPSLVEIPALASIAVAWHRLVLQGEGVRSPFYLRLDSTMWLYTLVVLAFFIPGFAPFMLVDAAILVIPEDPGGPAAVSMVWALSAAGFAILFLVLPRLSLVLPAIALGEPLSLAGAWRAGRRNTWRLAWATLLCALPPAVPFIPLAWLADSGTRASSSIVGTISSLAYVLIITIAVTLLSLAYRHLVLRQGSGPETAA